MNIIRHKDGHVCASFEDDKTAGKFFFGLPHEVRDQYTLTQQDIQYPYYYIWQWELRQSDPTDALAERDRSKDTFDVVTEKQLEAFCQTYKRDPEVEKLDSWDDQYFYVGVIDRDGVDFGIRQQLGLPDGKGTPEQWGGLFKDDGLSFLFDHHHMDWSQIACVKSMGVHKAFMNYFERIKYKKIRFARKRLIRYSRQNTLTPKAYKKWVRYSKRELRAVFGKAATISAKTMKKILANGVR